MTASFGARLRLERERQRIELETIARSTKISIGLLEALERNDASRWPSGIFRRAFIRAYADAIGLDREEIVREFLERFPDPAAEPYPSAPPSGALRLTLADEPSRFGPARLNAPLGWSRRASAAVYDLAIVIGIAAAVFAVAGSFWMPFAVATVCYHFGGVLALGNSPCAWLLGRERKPVPRDSGVRRPVSESTVLAVDEPDDLAEFTLGRYTKAV
jgi:transcriptional regulator with XRE-family HTH domain